MSPRQTCSLTCLHNLDPTQELPVSSPPASPPTSFSLPKAGKKPPPRNGVPLLLVNINHTHQIRSSALPRPSTTLQKASKKKKKKGEQSNHEQQHRLLYKSKESPR